MHGRAARPLVRRLLQQPACCPLPPGPWKWGRLPRRSLDGSYPVSASSAVFRHTLSCPASDSCSACLYDDVLPCARAPPGQPRLLQWSSGSACSSVSLRCFVVLFICWIWGFGNLDCAMPRNFKFGDFQMLVLILGICNAQHCWVLRFSGFWIYI